MMKQIKRHTEPRIFSYKKMVVKNATEKKKKISYRPRRSVCVEPIPFEALRAGEG